MTSRDALLEAMIKETSATGRCPTCSAPVRELNDGAQFYPPNLLTEEVMVLALKKYPDLLSAAVQWSRERNGSLWWTVKDILSER